MKQNATITATYLLQIPITGSNSHSQLKLTRKERIYFYLHSKDNKEYSLKSYPWGEETDNAVSLATVQSPIQK